MNDNHSNNHKNEQDLVFYIKIQYRCNSSMQGTIQWMDGKKTCVFRSALELGNLINDAKQKSAESDVKISCSQWEDKESVS
jgi:hypothetical protein